MKFLSKAKNSTKKAITILGLVLTFICYTALSAGAAVDVSGGLEQIASPLKNQIKQVAAIAFAICAIVAIAIALFKLVSALLENHRTNEPINLKPIGFAFAAAVVCGLCSATTFFGWFGI